jgi:DNA-binding transcriptional MocR family regulator
VVPVPLTAAGIDTEQLELTLQQHPSARLLYLIPTFQNPAGVSLPEAGRRRVVELAQQYGVLVMEDDPYGLLRFEGASAPTLLEIDGGDNVVYSSSFTKTVAPGIRTGYLVLPERLVAPLAKLSENTYIAPNTFAEATLAAYCRAGRFEPNVERATSMLRQRRDAMEAALREHFPHGSRWTTPEGGYFYWVDLPAVIDTGQLLPVAAERGVPYIKGSDFCAGGGGGSSMRLAFSAVSPEQIGEGIARLGGLLSAAPSPAGV